MWKIFFEKHLQDEKLCLPLQCVFHGIRFKVN